MAFVLKKIKTILRIYILYVIVAGFLVFLFDYNSKEYKEKNIVDTSKYYSNKVGPDKIRLIDNRDLGWPIRVNLLQNAKSSVKICNYSIMGGEISDLYYGLILDTADRGVKIDFLINGVMINIYGPRNAKFWALVNHPNINVRIYEPLNLLKPWTINNRMHDKIWIVDGKYAMTGGKNVADKFFVDVEDSKKVYDRDVLIKTTNSNDKDSVINDFEKYFSQLWNSEFIVVKKEKKSKYKQDKAKLEKERLLANLNKSREEKSYGFEDDFNLDENFYSTRKISLVTNPLQRIKKDPVVLNTVNALVNDAKDSVIMQSPYVILNKELRDILKIENPNVKLHVLTNSPYSSPNLAAISATLNTRSRLVENSSQVYGYQGKGSVHSKACIVDGNLSMVGSFNLDPRSTFLSTENFVVVDSEEFTKALTDDMKSIMEKSYVYGDEKNSLVKTEMKEKQPSMAKRVLLSISRVLFYFLDNLI